ncbi:efflux RND transporter periplasmic adaptor subunit [Caulobacter hibisci]|uniref:Efflux RND transporter periplasmic adaptor subunit n=1 Tax=Caulobacter hibisci TaxID=2035993 RepID=A0ABS0STX7_9CAUL|nr:efflux RND transporter periplasmic adaptor subunit [Caulobacter hibisci]MBI1682410.1 efflux RND transporter periplasmic adaptor subunit [Caulobacter hibisci]
MTDPRPSLPVRKPSRRSRIIGGAVAIAALAGVGVLAWTLLHNDTGGGDMGGGPGGPGGPGGGGGRRGPASTVAVATAAKADLPVIIEALGTVTPAATVTVKPQVSGVITQVLFREGQLVQAGQTLVQIDPRPFQMSLMEAQGNLTRDDAQLSVAQLTLKRYQTLLAQDSIARQEVDTQAATVKQLEGTVMADRAAVGTARLNVGFARIVAPVSGRVGLRVVDVGNYIASGDSSGVAVITTLSPIDVEFTVPQDDVPRISQRVFGGATLPVTVLDRTRANTLDQGTFSTLDNLVDTGTGTVKGKARFPNTGGKLFPSQFVNVRIQLDTLKDAIVVPATAVRQGSDGSFVWKLKSDQTVTKTKVTTGQATTTQVAVTQGLAIGDKVITEGGDRLTEGGKVQLPGQVQRQGAGKGGKGERGKGGPSGGGEGRRRPE